MDIELHVERLVLEGFSLSATDAAAVRAAVEAELARLLGGGSLASYFLTGVALPYIEAPQVRLGATARPASLARQIAGAVMRGMGHA